MPRHRKKSRIYWRERGGQPRAYADFRDFADVGGGREALVPRGAKIATSDPDIADALVAARIEELQERRRNKHILGAERQSTLQKFAAHHLLQKSRAGRVTDSWLEVAESHLDTAIEFFGGDVDLRAIDPPAVGRFVQWLAQQPSGKGQTCPECGERGVSAERPKDPLRWACPACAANGQDVNWQADGLSPATQRKYINSLSNMYRRAASEGYVPPGYNPVAALMEKPIGSHREAEWLEVHEAALLLEAARPREIEALDFSAVAHPKRRAFLEALAETGVRAKAAERAGVDPTVVYTAAWQGDAAFQDGLCRCEPRRDRQDLAVPPAQLYAILATFLLTGGRKSEVLGLAMEDVSFDRRTVTFRPHPWRRLKTRTSHRTVPLWPQLEEILRTYIFGGDGPPARLLFPSSRSEKEQPITDLRKALDSVAERVGWTEGEIRTKRFRHTYCAARLQTLDRGAPVSPFTVAREMGHGGQSLVDRVYGHLGEVRHRSEVVEYRVEQHGEKLRERQHAG